MIGADDLETAGARPADRGEVVRRLDARGWIAIETSQADRRAKALRVTDAGRALLAKMQPVVETIEAEMMRALTRSEAGAFINMIVKILEKNNEESRAPYRDIRGA